MYSPSISKSLIPLLYRLRCQRHIPMTRLVNELILKALSTEQLTDEILAMMPEMIAPMITSTEKEAS